MSNLPLPVAAFLAGLISFLSPCVLPLVPGYVSLISGAGVEELKVQDSRLLRRVMLQSVMFILGFSVVFITLGALSTSVGQLLARYKSTLAQVAGVVIILFGLHLTGIFRINALYADKRLHGVKGGASPWGAFVIGFAFAFGWTPCVGPILSAVMALEIGDIGRFPGPGQLASYAGLVPSVHSSGGHTRMGRVRGDVNRTLKWALVEAANLIAMQQKRWPGSHTVRLYRRVKERKNHQKAVVAVARHLAEAAWHVLTEKKIYREPKSKAPTSSKPPASLTPEQARPAPAH